MKKKGLTLFFLGQDIWEYVEEFTHLVDEVNDGNGNDESSYSSDQEHDSLHNITSV